MIGRYIVEECPTNKPVRNFVTLGSPNKGLSPAAPGKKGILFDLLYYIEKERDLFKDN